MAPPTEWNIYWRTLRYWGYQNPVVGGDLKQYKTLHICLTLWTYEPIPNRYQNSKTNCRRLQRSWTHTLPNTSVTALKIPSFVLILQMTFLHHLFVLLVLLMSCLYHLYDTVHIAKAFITSFSLHFYCGNTMFNPLHKGHTERMTVFLK